jgi:hypothetical protein
LNCRPNYASEIDYGCWHSAGLSKTEGPDFVQLHLAMITLQDSFGDHALESAKTGVGIVETPPTSELSNIQNQLE